QIVNHRPRANPCERREAVDAEPAKHRSWVAYSNGRRQMPFLLSRGGANVPAEVQRWQYFLLKQGFAVVGSIDSDFGANSETGTKLFQTRSGIPVTGKLDTRTLDTAQTLGY